MRRRPVARHRLRRRPAARHRLRRRGGYVWLLPLFKLRVWFCAALRVLNSTKPYAQRPRHTHNARPCMRGWGARQAEWTQRLLCEVLTTD